MIGQTPVRPHMHATHYSIWYKDEVTYNRFREICDDKVQFAQPYADWVKHADDFIREVEARVGQKLVKVNAEPEEFLAWCRVNSKRPDSPSRSAFAAFKGGQAHEARN
jgi:hypothetical protein